MTAAIITIGDEILIGQVTDTNSGYIAKSLESAGVSITEMLSVSDNRQHILDTLSRYQDKVDFILITGGLGPTKDDITKKTLAAYFEDTLVSDQKVLDHVRELFTKFAGSVQPLLQVNIDQALVPSKATVLFNAYGTAPGIWMKQGQTVFISMPGVPFEMKGILDNIVIPKIVREFQRPFILHKTILTYGIGESALADRIVDWENALPEFIKLAYLPSPGRVRLRLSARGADKHRLEDAIAANVASLQKILGDIIAGYDDSETIEVVLGRQLTEKKLTVATAESCTGGKIAHIITSIPGSSKYFKGSIVSYAEEIKTGVLGVPANVIEKHSVVSAEVASEMASRVRALMKTDCGIGITGNAGPTTDDTDEEVGIVFIAIATADRVVTERFNFGQPREKVIGRAVNKSLEMLLREISKKG